MQFHVVGLGSIGSLLSHHLRRAIPESYTINLIYKSRSHYNESSLRGGSIQVDTNSVTTTASGFSYQFFEDIPDQPKSPPGPDSMIDSLFVTTKAQQTFPVIHRLRPRLSRDSTIVLLQNGIGVYDELVQAFFQNPAHRPHFILASTTHGAYIKAISNHVVHTGIGDIIFAIVPDPAGRNFEASLNTPNIQDRRPRIADITTSDDHQFTHYKSLRDTVAALTLLRPLNTFWKPMSEVQLAMKRKLVINAVINPLTALMGCRNGDIFTSPATERLCQKICHEAASVYAADILSRTHNPSRESDYSCVPAVLLQDSLISDVHRVADTTRNNISSMLADIRRGRDTEIDYINGYLLKLGSSHGLEMPTNTALVDLVKMRSAIPLDQML